MVTGNPKIMNGGQHDLIPEHTYLNHEKARLSLFLSQQAQSSSNKTDYVVYSCLQDLIPTSSRKLSDLISIYPPAAHKVASVYILLFQAISYNEFLRRYHEQS